MTALLNGIRTQLGQETRQNIYIKRVSNIGYLMGAGDNLCGPTR